VGKSLSWLVGGGCGMGRGGRVLVKITKEFIVGKGFWNVGW
jgi:hypothetical protein